MNKNDIKLILIVMFIVIISFVIISAMLYIFYKKIVTKKSSFVESL